MRAVGLTTFGGPDVLHIVDLPVPEPGPGEVPSGVDAVVDARRVAPAVAWC